MGNGNEKENESDNRGDYKVKLICSYGGKIQPRPHDHRLSYVGGDTKILAVDRRIKFSDIVAKIISICNATEDVSLKYQLPGEDLDALVSVINDDDLEHMMDEYDRIRSLSSKPPRLRLFLFSSNPHPKPASSASLNPDFLFGFDKEYECGPQTVPKPEIPWSPDTINPFTSGSNLRNVGDIQSVIQGIPGQSLACLQETFESHVTIGDHVPGRQLVYRIPVTGGVYPAGAAHHGMPAMGVLPPAIVYQGLPVCTFVPATTTSVHATTTSVQEQKLGFNAVVGVVPPNPTETVAATFCQDAKNNI